MKTPNLKRLTLILLLLAMVGGSAGCLFRVRVRHFGAFPVWIWRFTLTYCGTPVAVRWRVAIWAPWNFINASQVAGATGTFSGSVDRDGQDIPVSDDPAAKAFLEANDPFSKEFPEIPTDAVWKAFASNNSIPLENDPNVEFNFEVQFDGNSTMPAEYTTYVVGSPDEDFSRVYLVKIVCGDDEAECQETILRDDITAPIPTVSEWGLIILTLLGMTAGTIMLARRRRPVTAAH